MVPQGQRIGELTLFVSQEDTVCLPLYQDKAMALYLVGDEDLHDDTPYMLCGPGMVRLIHRARAIYIAEMEDAAPPPEAAVPRPPLAC